MSVNGDYLDAPEVADAYQGALEVSGQTPIMEQPSRHSVQEERTGQNMLNDVIEMLGENNQTDQNQDVNHGAKHIGSGVVHAKKHKSKAVEKMKNHDSDGPLMIQGTKTARGQINITGSLTKAKISKPKDLDEVLADSEELGPPKCGAFKPKKNIPPTQFKAFYERGDLPISLDCSVHGPCVRWNHPVEVEKLDYHHYLPLFFDGLRETKETLYTIAYNGACDMLVKAPHKALAVIPQLIIPIKEALNTREPSIVCRTLKLLKKLVLCHAGIGEALVPYYRQLLPALNALKSMNRNTGDGIDYRQHRGDNVGDLINETLTLLEQTGGPDAFINIKYMIPTYESCIFN